MSQTISFGEGGVEELSFTLDGAIIEVQCIDGMYSGGSWCLSVDQALELRDWLTAHLTVKPEGESRAMNGG